MAIVASDIDFLKSATGTSDGGAESSNEITSGLANDLWPNISDALRTTGGTRYKKFYIKNSNGTETMVQPTVWIAEAPVGLQVYLGRGAGSSNDATNTQGNMTAFAASAKVALISTGSDGRSATIIGLDTSGDPQQEVVTLTGTTEVLSVGTYSKVWTVYLNTTNGSNTVTVKQGAGGTTRGTIGPTLICCWLWVLATSKATGILNPDLLPSTSIPVWCKQTWDAGIGAIRPTRQVVAVEETP